MLYLLYLFIWKIELPHYYASLKLLNINCSCINIKIGELFTEVHKLCEKCASLFSAVLLASMLTRVHLKFTNQNFFGQLSRPWMSLYAKYYVLFLLLSILSKSFWTFFFQSRTTSSLNLRVDVAHWMSLLIWNTPRDDHSSAAHQTSSCLLIYPNSWLMVSLLIASA